MPEQFTAEQQREAIAAEYGEYVATEPIDIGGARAFNVGDAVPVSHVERGVVPADAVAKRTTKTAGRAVAAAAGTEQKG